MTFDEMKTHAIWIVIRGITHGHAIESTMHEVLILCLNWRAEEDKKAAKPRRARKPKEAA